MARATSTLEITGQSARSAGPDLDTGTIRGVRHADVGNVDVLHNVDLSDVLSERANGDTVGAVADKVLHNDVGGVGLERNAVVAVVDVGVLDDDVAAAISVPSVGILGRVAARASARDVNVGEDDICRIGHEVVPLRAVAKLQVLDSGTLEANCAKEDGAKDVDVLRIKVVPGLAVTVEGTTTVDVHIFATKLEESGGVLVSLVEGVLLPVVGIVGELDGSLDVCEQYEQGDLSGFTRIQTYQDRCASER